MCLHFPTSMEHLLQTGGNCFNSLPVSPSTFPSQSNLHPPLPLSVSIFAPTKEQTKMTEVPSLKEKEIYKFQGSNLKIPITSFSACWMWWRENGDERWSGPFSSGWCEITVTPAFSAHYTAPDWNVCCWLHNLTCQTVPEPLPSFCWLQWEQQS